MGHKNEKDLSICIGSFQKLSSLDFITMYSKGEIKILPKAEPKTEKKENIPSQEDLRLLRLAYFDKK
jgi:hypothetical protein